MGPLYFARRLHKRLRWTRRYSQISRILLRCGLLPYLRSGRRSEFRTAAGRARLARPLRRALEDGGVTFVKLGQVLATRRDLLPEEFVTELSGLQDDVAPVAWPEIDQVIRAELGAGADELFACFERTPVAAASIAQVHAATLRSGRRVVVKVCRPGPRCRPDGRGTQSGRICYTRSDEPVKIPAAVVIATVFARCRWLTECAWDRHVPTSLAGIESLRAALRAAVRAAAGRSPGPASTVIRRRQAEPGQP